MLHFEIAPCHLEHSGYLYGIIPNTVLKWHILVQSLHIAKIIIHIVICVTLWARAIAAHTHFVNLSIDSQLKAAVGIDEATIWWLIIKVNESITGYFYNTQKSHQQNVPIGILIHYMVFVGHKIF